MQSKGSSSGEAQAHQKPVELDLQARLEVEEE